jgi:hypothetical protein
VNIVLDKRKRNKLLNTLDNNVEPKNLRRTSRITSRAPVAPVRVKTSLYKVSDFKPKIPSVIPIVYPTIDVNL